MIKKCSVILAFFNDTKALKLVLDSLQSQYRSQFEVIVADDGSSVEANSVLKTLTRNYSFKIRHLWHPDQGFRKTVILNRAILDAKTDHLIFLDADCVPQENFVDDHLKGLVPGVCQAGRRVDVFYEALDHFANTEPSKFFSKHWLQFTAWSLQKKAKNVERGIRLPRKLAQKLQTKPWSIVGCNFSVCKQDLVAINGFDERASVPWGAEDSDVERRLLKAGIRLRGLRYQAPVIHFDSSFNKRGKSQESDQERLKIFLEAKAEDRTWTRHGIIKEDRSDPVLYRSA
jgi:glycosyltransferase involved in cell wall biosynthesis